MMRSIPLGLLVLSLLMPSARAQTVADSQPIYLVLRVPADAVVEIDGQRTSQTGSERRYVSPALPVGTYGYHLRATWTDQGRKMVAEKRVQVRTGQDTVVDLRSEGIAESTPPVVKKVTPLPTPPVVKKEVTPPTPPVVTKEVPRPVKETPMKPAVVKKEAVTPPVRPPEKAPAATAGQILVAFVATPHEVVEKMLALAEVTKDDVVLDLGCGDGRIPLHAAQKHGARGIGIELDKELVAKARADIKKANVEERVKILEGDLQNADVSEATVVALYLLPDVNDQIAPLLLRQLKPGSRVVSHDFPISKWKLDRKQDTTDKDGVDHTLYLYKIDAQK